MPRINIEDKFFGDSRFLKLCSLAGSAAQAIGICVLCWRMGQKYFADNRMIPLAIFKQIDGWELMLKCGLAKRTRNGIYVSGSRDHFEWIKQKQEAGRKGAKSLWEKNGDRHVSFDEKWPLAPALALDNKHGVDSITRDQYLNKKKNVIAEQLRQLQSRSSPSPHAGGSELEP